MKTMTMGMYARVSTGRQEQERTIESQVAAIDQHVAAMGATIDPKHRYLDDGWSGETLRRPGLDALRDAVAQEHLDAVVMYDADRLARRFVDQQVVLDELARKGVELIFVHGGVARTDEERMALSMRGVFAEYERAKILDRTRRGMLHRARSGAPPGWANPPYGYRYLPGARHEAGTVLVEECEASVVRQIFAWVGCEGLPLRQVAQRLEQQGVASRSGRLWKTSTLGGLVRNRVYVGCAHHQKYEAVEPRRPRDRHSYRRRRKSSFRRRSEEQWISARVPALIDEELFAKAQQRLRYNRRRTAGQAKHPYLLRGLLLCTACGRRLWARAADSGGRGEYRYYSCGGRDRFSGLDATPCPRPALRADGVEHVVWQDLERWLQEPEQLAAQLEAQQDKAHTRLEAYERERRRLVREARAIEGAISRLVDAYQAGAITLDELRARRERLEESKKQCEARLTKGQREQRRALQQRDIVDELQRLKEQLRRGLERCAWEDRRAIVELLVDKIEVTSTTLCVHYIVPLDLHGAGTSGRGEPRRRTDGPKSIPCRPCPRAHAHAHEGRARKTEDGVPVPAENRSRSDKKEEHEPPTRSQDARLHSPGVLGVLRFSCSGSMSRQDKMSSQDARLHSPRGLPVPARYTRRGWPRRATARACSAP
ncbi:recombinase family protein [Sorangium sp. So ce1182]|uniref:recombinase family protein n=1 Tax=Sorangium sp. So ce1182 TaxID=3133334 RepID=UPI003F6151D3